jgi:hypothetical protein
MTHQSKSFNAATPHSLPSFQQTPESSYVMKRSIPAWALSLLLHATIFGILILVLTQVRNGAGNVENRSGGIVLVDATSETTEYLSEGDVEQNSSPNTKSESPPPLAAKNDLPPDLPGMESSRSEISGAGESLAESLPGADSLIIGPEFTGKIGGQVTTEIFGVKGTGSRFVYVIDRSESMAGFEFRPMLAARQELWKSLNSLQKNNQFQIVFYNNDVKIFNGELRLYFATVETIEQAKGFIERVRPDGGTDHMAALKEAFKFAPDVIFFLTDAEGGFTDADLREIGRRNRSAAIINAIEFGERRSGNRSLEAVARNSGGQYIFKNINTLRLDGN